MLLLQTSDAIKKIRSRHKYTEHVCIASLAYAESQESQACTCHLESLEPILLVFTFNPSSKRDKNLVKSLLLILGTTKEGG